MAGTPETIVLDPAKPALERAEATNMRAKMLQETVGTAGKNIMDMVTQYQDLKAQKQKGDLASMTMAATLSGGYDKLPQEAKNKLPSIIGQPLPTDAQGNVQISPDTDTVIKRMTLDAMQKNPDIFKTLIGAQKPASDPADLANQVKLEEMRLGGEREKTAADNARNQATNDTNIQKTILENQSRELAALTAGKSKEEAARIRAANSPGAMDAKPSPFILDPKTNTLMTEPQWYNTYPNTVMPTKLSYGDAKAISGQKKAQAAVDASNSSVAANQARLDAATFKMKNMIANQGTDEAGKRLKLVTDSLRMSLGTPNEQKMRDWANSEIPNILGGAGFKPDDLAALSKMTGPGGWGGWSLSNFDSAMGQTSTGAQPTLTQPLVATIPGLSPPAVNIAAGVVRNALGGGAKAPAAPGAGNVLSGDDAKNYLGIK